MVHYHYRTALRFVVAGLFFLSSNLLGLPGKAQLLPLWHFRTANDIPPWIYKNNPTIPCIVAKVTDGDTVRVQHKPWWLLFPKNKGKLTDTTISVRLYGIDAPETGQLWGEEATKFVKKYLTPKRQVQVKLLARDRYGRAVGSILYRKRCAFIWELEDLSKELLRKGLAIVCTGQGISYDGQFVEMERLEAGARKFRKGIWMNGGLDETPSQYRMRKRRRHTTTCQLSH